MKLERSNIEAWLLDRIEGRLTPDQERELQAYLLTHPDIASELGELPSLENESVTFAGKDLLKRSIPPTGTITAANLDDFLVARMEGDLTPGKLAELERCIAQDPQAAKAARQMAVARIGNDAVPFVEKPSLARSFPPQGMPDRHRLDDFLVARMEGGSDADQEAALTALLNADPQAAKSWALMQRTRITSDAVAFPDKATLKRREGKVIALWSRTAFRYAAAASIALLLGLWFMVKRDRPEEQFANDKPMNASVPLIAKGVNDGKDASAPLSVKEENEGVNGTSPAPSIDPANREVGIPAMTEGPRPQPPVAPQHVAPSRLEMLDPRLATRTYREVPVPIDGTVPQVPISHDAPVEVAASEAGAMTVGQLFASAVRTGVLDQPRSADRKLDGDDALALADKGLQAIAGDNAGVRMERSAHRRRFNLHFGEGLALTASTSR